VSEANESQASYSFEQADISKPLMKMGDFDVCNKKKQ
jgi:hypothetical protein